MPRKHALRLKTYALVQDAVDRGALLGWNRAFKHTDDPNRDTILENVARAVMESLDEVVDWEKSG